MAWRSIVILRRFALTNCCPNPTLENQLPPNRWMIGLQSRSGNMRNQLMGLSFYLVIYMCCLLATRTYFAMEFCFLDMQSNTSGTRFQPCPSMLVNQGFEVSWGCSTSWRTSHFFCAPPLLLLALDQVLNYFPCFQPKVSF